jgi:hypothetical protein
MGGRTEPQQLDTQGAGERLDIDGSSRRQGEPTMNDINTTAPDTLTEAEKIEIAKRAVNREYCRRWREKNRKHCREYHKKWRKAHPGYYAERYKEWCKKNPEKVKAYRNKWYLKKYEELTREQNEPK